MTTTASQEHFTQAARTGQEAMSTAIRTWGETAQSVLGMGTGRSGDEASPDRLVDAWFDIAGEALAAQRELTKAVLTAGTPMIDALSRAATRTIEAAQEATQEASRQATEAPAQDTQEQDTQEAPRTTRAGGAREATRQATEATAQNAHEVPRTTRASGTRKDS
jgi:cobalamin biosynthesis Mg chelatase CobN